MTKAKTAPSRESNRCRWFALCENPAVTTSPHPVLGDVPVCQRCVDKLGLPTCPDSRESIWIPASGYRTESGKSKWRCWNESAPGGSKELLNADGKVWLCDYRLTAEHKCAELNAASRESVEPETPVLFRVARDEGEDYLTAVFPTIPASMDRHTMTCYAHIGQHSGCSFGWYHTTRAAKPEEYAALARELESIGYRLKVYKRLTRGHREAFDATLADIRKR